MQRITANGTFFCDKCVVADGDVAGIGALQSRGSSLVDSSRFYIVFVLTDSLGLIEHKS